MDNKPRSTGLCCVQIPAMVSDEVPWELALHCFHYQYRSRMLAKSVSIPTGQKPRRQLVQRETPSTAGSASVASSGHQYASRGVLMDNEGQNLLAWMAPVTFN